MKPKIAPESNESVQNRLRTREENSRAIQEAVADRTSAITRRTNPRRSIITGAVRTPIFR